MSGDDSGTATTRRGFAKQVAAFLALGMGVSLAGARNAYAAGGYCICDDGTHGCASGTQVCFDNCNHTSCCTGIACQLGSPRENRTDCPCGG